MVTRLTAPLQFAVLRAAGERAGRRCVGAEWAGGMDPAEAAAAQTAARAAWLGRPERSPSSCLGRSSRRRRKSFGFLPGGRVSLSDRGADVPDRAGHVEAAVAAPARAGLFAIEMLAPWA